MSMINQYMEVALKFDIFTNCTHIPGHDRRRTYCQAQLYDIEYVISSRLSYEYMKLRILNFYYSNMFLERLDYIGLQAHFGTHHQSSDRNHTPQAFRQGSYIVPSGCDLLQYFVPAP